MSMKFKTAYSEHSSVFSRPGSKIKNLYQKTYDSKGREVLVKTGEKSLYDEIQASLESTKIENILARHVGSDLSALGLSNGVFGDNTVIPRTPLEALRQVDNIKRNFDNLSPEVKFLFESADDYFNSVASGEFLNRIQKLSVDNTESEVDSVES